MPLHRRLFRALAASLTMFLAVAAAGQTTVPAVLLSDIHFDPFHNPHLFAQLQQAPVERWPAILDATPDLVEDADRAALELECHSHGVDTPWPLLKTSLAAAHDAHPAPVFVSLSGDLLTHQFPCRFHHVARGATPAELSAFAAKTVAFVSMELKRTWPRTPVYVALGNNDSGCEDYRESAGSPFMKSFAGLLAADVARRPAARAQTDLQVSPEGDYSLTLPSPLQRGRLIVLEDIFDSVRYAPCSGTDDRSAQADQIRWLRTQLGGARAAHQQVWVIAHIPPGVDVYASFAKYVFRPGDVCSAKPPPFLANHDLTDALLDYADVVRLAIFGHTHMDEIRLLHRDAGVNGPPATVAAKLVPSITPYFGNHPAFMVADIDPRSLTLKDWQTYVSPGPNGSTPPWALAYRFSAAYHLPEFSAATVQQLADDFTADRTGRDPRASAYRQHFYPGDVGLYALGLAQLWPAYACSVREFDGAAFHNCLCPPK